MRRSASNLEGRAPWPANDVQSIHTRLARFVERSLGHGLQVHMRPSANGWKELAKDRLFDFEMQADYDGYSVDYARRELGGRCFVVKLLPDLSETAFAAWASWQSTWGAEGKGYFSLKAASWTFFWGQARSEEKTQLFRAEWHLEGAEDAPQPHWNLDTKPTLSLSAANARDWVLHAKSGIGVASRASGGSPITSLAKLHLAMGGWRNAASHPDCWICAVPGDQDLLNWAKNTFAHAVTEFRRP